MNPAEAEARVRAAEATTVEALRALNDCAKERNRLTAALAAAETEIARLGSLANELKAVWEEREGEADKWADKYHAAEARVEALKRDALEAVQIDPDVFGRGAVEFQEVVLGRLRAALAADPPATDASGG